MPLLEREAWARQKLQSGTCDAIVEIAVNAKKESLNHCQTMHLNPQLNILPITDYNLMRGGSIYDVELANNISEAILQVLGSTSYNEMLARNFRFSETCGEVGTDEMITVEQVSRVLHMYDRYTGVRH